MVAEYWNIETGEEVTEDELYRQYDEMLDEVSGPVQIGSLTYDASRVLKEVDPIAYNIGFSEWLDSELGETITDEDPNTEDEEDSEN